jgi:hypothetical protein
MSEGCGQHNQHPILNRVDTGVICREAAEEMLQQYSDVVRWTLLISGGYECQEQEGSYMIVFASAAAALEWSLLVQEALMEVNWSSHVRCMH